MNMALLRSRSRRRAAATQVVLLRLRCPECGSDRFFKATSLSELRSRRTENGEIELRSPCPYCGSEQPLMIRLVADGI